MKQLARVLVLVVLASVQVADRPAWAEEHSPSRRLHLTLSRRPPVVQPLPDPSVAEKDAERAIAEIKARERRDELIRQLTEGRFRRPDLDRDVIGGIQSRNLTDALRRR